MYESVEVLTSGYCPFNCKYCYIPKTGAMLRLHQSIVGSLDKFLECIPDNISALSFWGTEPALTLPSITSSLPKIKRALPRLREISFSTSMMYRPEVFSLFIREASALGVSLKIQISLDGPAFITDVNRMDGASELIPKHFLSLVKDIQDVNSKVEFRWKPTLTIDNMRLMSIEPDRISEYKEYFEDIYGRFNAVNRNSNITLARGYAPTLVVPGKYTSRDGQVFYNFIKAIHQARLYSSYHYRLKRIISFFDELYKRRMFTCSGGDSNIGLGWDMHICHRTFYLNQEAYVRSVLESDIENWDVSLFRRGNIDMIRDYYIVEPDNELERTRFQYVLRGHHDFWRQHLQASYVLLKELAECGQVSSEYLENEGLCELFTIFLNSALNCPVESLLNAGSINIPLASLIRIFCNGAFKEILKGVIEHELSRRK